MKNIIFDFGNVLLKVGTYQDLIRSLNCIEDVGYFCEKYEDIILESHVNNTIDFFDFIKEKSNLGTCNKKDLLTRATNLANISLLQQIPELSKKYNLYILSDIMKEMIPFFLKRYEIHNYFTGIVQSCDVGYLKPNKEIYEFLIKEYKIIPEESIFFDDREVNIEGAKNVGIKGRIFNDFDINIINKLGNE